jgi:16S rRNA (guanine527-N7)-methyltransferase
MLVEHYFSHLTPNQLSQFERLPELYTLWNNQINVISRKDLDNFEERHVLHSLAIAKVIQFKPGTRILDIGTGGGFPGIPLAIMFPEVQFHLVDSIGKKIKVVNEIVNALELTNVMATHDRAENVKGQYDFIVSRAVTRMINFMPWTRNKFKLSGQNTLRNGILYLKGGDIHEELNEVDAKHFPTIYNISDYFSGEFFETKKVVYFRMV